jgi:uncharacterized protein YlaI
MYGIECCVCEKQGSYADIHRDGWQLARNAPDYYICSPDCEQRLKEIQDSKKR